MPHGEASASCGLAEYGKMVTSTAKLATLLACVSAGANALTCRSSVPTHVGSNVYLFTRAGRELISYVGHIREQLLPSLLKELRVSLAPVAADRAIRVRLLRALVRLCRDKGSARLVAAGAVDLRVRGVVEGAGKRRRAGREYSSHFAQVHDMLTHTKIFSER